MSKDINSYYYKDFLGFDRRTHRWFRKRFNDIILLDDLFREGVDNSLNVYNEYSEIDPTYNERMGIKNRRFHVYLPVKSPNIFPFFKVEYEDGGDPAYILVASCEYSPEYKDVTRILDVKEKEDLVRFLHTKSLNPDKNKEGHRDEADYYENWVYIYSLADETWGIENRPYSLSMLDLHMGPREGYNDKWIPDYKRLPKRRELI